MLLKQAFLRALLGRIGSKVLSWLGRAAGPGKITQFIRTGRGLRTIMSKGLYKIPSAQNIYKGLLTFRKTTKGWMPQLTGLGYLHAYAPELVGAGTLGLGGYLGYKMLKTSELEKQAFFQYIPLLLGGYYGIKTLAKASKTFPAHAILEAGRKAMKTGVKPKALVRSLGRAARTERKIKLIERAIKAKDPLAYLRRTGNIRRVAGAYTAPKPRKLHQLWSQELHKEMEKRVGRARMAHGKPTETVRSHLKEILSTIQEEHKQELARVKQYLPPAYKPSISRQIGYRNILRAALPIGAGIAGTILLSLLTRQPEQRQISPYYGYPMQLQS